MALSPSTGWGYYTEIAVSNPASNYQMRLEIRRGSGTNDTSKGIIYDQNKCYYSDMRDVRVGTTSDPSTATQLSQWTETNGVSSGNYRRMWVKTNGTSTIYIFIGNSSASEYSSASTWDHLDEFESDSTSEWTDTRATDNKSTVYERWDTGYNQRVVFKAQVTDWEIDTFGSSIRLGFFDGTGNKDSSDAVFIEVNNDLDNGAGSYIIALGCFGKAGGTLAKTYGTASFSQNTHYLFQGVFTSSHVRAMMHDLDYTQKINITEGSYIPSSAPSKNLIELWDCNEDGHMEHMAYLSTPKDLELYVQRGNV